MRPVHKVIAEGGIFLKLDLEKAFDNVSHSFMFRCLQTMGFGEVFCGWLKLLYNQATSVVECNGSL